MRDWHPAKIAAIIGIITLLASVIGSAMATGAVYGSLNHQILMIVERLERHVNQIKELETRMDRSEIDRSALNARWVLMYDSLCRIENQALRNFKLSEDTNRTLKGK